MQTETFSIQDHLEQCLEAAQIEQSGWKTEKGLLFAIL